VPRDVVKSLHQVATGPDRARITARWGTVNQTPDDKARRIATLTTQLAESPGDAAAGRQVFALLCAACHHLHGEGRNVGPDLTGIDRNDRAGLLQSIVDPSASVLPDFMAFTLKLRPRPGEEERQLAGFIQNETANGLTLVDTAGTRTPLASSDIAERTALPVSLMPDGLLDSLTSDQIRNLFAWLQSQPKP
jgi:putative heme-binding domain-containing protein